MTDENKDNESNALKEQAVNTLANKYLSNATLGEALALVPFGTLVQLVQNQVLNQSNNEVGSMTEEQIKELINSDNPAESAPPAEDGK